ncbi:TonB family protein [Thalassotalea sp. 1_MG-2023]|uniref:M56 family metallopeptidase n=1 Tax=Thalassotalea sp. 1_MG-2023 TaxID=3062680 RepID=UPI0026E1D95D|nr:M56 family metallopeptidase [Thalassotalea sp. 1_MG-2023]MDO6425610.1 TonB family protein [Thalassotalea sp. 1_MG-2023]
MDSIENSAILYYLALTLIHFLWQGGLIALTLKFSLVLTSFKHTNIRYLLSTTAMAMCLIVPIVTFFLIYQPDISPSLILQNALPASDTDELFLVTNPQTWQQDVLGSLPILSILWLATVSILAMKLIIELYHVVQLPKHGVKLPSKPLNNTFEALVEKIKLTRKPKLLIALHCDVPMAIGWLKPVVLIPAAMITGLTPAQLSMLMLHELAHIKRYDYLVNLLQTLIETLLFFHPAVRWISKQMRNEREYCSDDIAVALSGDALAYAHTLTDTASLCHHHRHHAIPTMAMAASGGDLKKRVLRLVDQHHCAKTDESGKFLASVLIIVSILAVALKPYIKMPIVDLSSGYISFASSATDAPRSFSENEAQLSQASIANLLINQDKVPKDNNTNTSHEVISTTAPTLASNETSIDQEVNQSIEKQEQKLKKNIIAPLEKKPALSNETVASESLNIEQAPKSAIETILPVTEKSSSELAFERTSSSNKASRLENPYSQQVAALNHEPEIEKNQDQVKRTVPLPIPHSRLVAFTQPKETTPVNIAPPPVRSKALLLTSPDPRYPSSAKRKGLEIDVAVNFTIDTLGRVKNIEFEKKSRVSYFKSAIRNAMAKWRFQPAKVNNKPIESKMTKIFSFSLMK